MPRRGGDQWNVHLPGLIGVVAALVVGLVVWNTFGGDDESATGSVRIDGVTTIARPNGGGASTSMPAGGSTPTTTPPGVALPPVTVDPSGSTAPDATASTAPVTAAPGAVDGAVPGDLAIDGRPMQRPPCTGGYITILASSVGGSATAGSIGSLLASYPGSEYLRTDQTCASLRASVDGQPIYVVYLGPFGDAADACAARAQGPEGAYPRRLSDEPDAGVTCP